MTKKFTFLLMALLALAGFKSWANPVVSSPSGSNDRETYNIAIADLTPDRWDFFCSLSAEEGSTVQVSYSPVTGYETYEPHVICEITGTHESIDISDFTDAGDYYYANFTMPANNVTVTASFEPSGDLYNVHPQTPFTGGTVNIDHINNLSEGTMVRMWVTPDTQNHYTFDAAHYQDKISVEYGDGQHVQVSAYDNYYFFYMPAADVTVDVIFDEEPNHTITVNNPEGCTITVLSEPKYYEGREIYFEYELASGYRFNSWNVKYDDGVHVSPQSVTVYDNKPWNGDYYFIMPEGPVTITANVTHVTTHTITVVQPAVGGTISVSTTEAAVGDPVYIYTNPAQGYTLNKWYVKNESGVVVIEDVTAGFYMLDYNVTVTADFVLAPQDLTVNEGTATNQTIPTTTAQTWYSTKSQFIIPYDQLESMFDGTITDLTFYADFNSFDFGDARWNVYVKEVDYQTLNDYVSTEGMTLVYNGGMAITNGQMHIDFDTDFQYSDNNLLIYFEQVQAGSCTDKWQNWYGVNTTKATAYAGYDYGSGQWDNYHYAQWFLPKTTIKYMPSANPQTRYAITVNQPEVGGTISASKALAVEGCTITLTATPAEGYILNQWIVTDGDGTIAVTDNQFIVRTSDVAVTAVFETLPRHAITITPNEHGTVRVNNDETPDENGYLEGAKISLSAQGNEGWTLAENGYIITPADPSVTVEIQQEWNSYYFLMPACNVTISSTFRELEQYTVTYHINGVESQETVYEKEYFYPSQPMLPAGTEWYGWITEDLESSYSTTQPENKFYGGEISEDMDLYAVFKFTETVPVEGVSTWEQVNNPAEVSDGDHVVMVSSSYGYYFLMGQRGSVYSGNFNATSSVSWENLINGNWPENATVFTAISESGNWKFRFKDAYHDEETYLADYNGSLVPVCQWGGDDSWTINWYGYVSNANGHYIYFHYSGKYFDFNSSSAQNMQLYKEVKPTQTNYYYMTSVLGFGGADEHITANTSVTNVVIAKNAKLTINNGVTLNVEGICLSASHDAAQLVIAEGGQLVHHNEGTVATFEKNITGYTNAQGNDGYYLIANPTNETAVANLTSNDFDLYTFDGAQEVEWRNAKEDDNFEVERGTGYLYANSETVTLEFAGELTPANSPDYSRKSLILAAAGEGRDFPGFNLIGNPFACNVYLDKPAYLLDGGEYQPIAANTAIAPCEGFFVEAESDGENLSISTSDPGLRGNSISLTVSQNRGSVIDRAIVSFDRANDLHKFMMNPAHTNIRLAKNGEEFAALSSDAEGEIPVSFKAEKDGSYTITVNTENVNAHYIHLIDNKTGMDVDLLATPSYTFNASTSDYAYRFKLVFSMTGVEENGSNANSFAYISNGNLVIDNIEGEATMQIVDMLGRVISTEIVSGSYNKALNLKAGLYIINLNGMTQKIVVK